MRGWTRYDNKGQPIEPREPFAVDALGRASTSVARNFTTVSESYRTRTTYGIRGNVQRFVDTTPRCTGPLEAMRAREARRLCRLSWNHRSAADRAIVALTALVLAAFAAACSGKEIQEERPARQGLRGESCRARNDCESGLACINQTCVQNEYAIAPSARECELIECAEDADCCAEIDDELCRALALGCPLVAPDYDEACDALETDCDGGDFEACDQYGFDCDCHDRRQQCEAGDTFACEQVDAYCSASRSCADYLVECACIDDCVDAVCLHRVACFDDTQCFGGNCVSGVCDFQCTTDEDCPDGSRCLDGNCTEVCLDRNECDLFEDCVDGTCVAVGCRTNRECAAFTRSALATCVEET